MKVNYAKHIATAVLLSLSMNAAWAGDETLVDLPGFDTPTQTSTGNTTPSTATAKQEDKKSDDKKSDDKKAEEKKPTTPTKPAPPKPAPPKPAPPKPAPPRPAPPEANDLNRPLHVGDSAVYSGYDVQIMEIYENGMARILFASGSSSIVELKDLAAARKSLKGFSVDERVLYAGYEVTIKKLYTNESALIEFQSGTKSVVGLTQFVKLLNSSQGWNIGQQAMYSNYLGTISQIYSNGTVKFRFESGTESVISITSLVRLERSMNGWVVGDRAMYSNYEGKIRTIYSNRTVEFVFESGSVSVISIDSLARILNSMSGWTVGEEVSYSDYKGVIKSIYSNGTAVFRFESGTQTIVSLSALVKIVRSLEGFYVGETVMYSGYEGKITWMLANKTVLVSYDSGRTAYTKTDYLVKIISSLNGVKVGTRGLINNYPGTVSRVYANGTIRFRFDNGAETLNSITSLIKAL
ncbi:hypothetical protein [Bdellovibrio sp. NC01]|uniref:hypothetical protein n=1 Tax=Bdellovibrio sp. NC01 TaxID=2220073 RepID=UPI0011594A05|nr:hypothetical protein [Bdellovibrio sp. NC01]QDK37064.1 hypothetical protein DOE51_05380 [Bdellovibrio sp. NC01]